jgi:hypothetical protein
VAKPGRKEFDAMNLKLNEGSKLNKFMNNAFVLSSVLSQ